MAQTNKQLVKQADHVPTAEWQKHEAESLRLARKEDWQCKIFGAIIWVLLSLFTCKGA